MLYTIPVSQGEMRDQRLHAGKTLLVRVSRNPAYNAPETNAAVRDGRLQVGDAIRLTLGSHVDETPAGTHDSIRDAASSRITWGWGVEFVRED